MCTADVTSPTFRVGSHPQGDVPTENCESSVSDGTQHEAGSLWRVAFDEPIGLKW